MKILFGFLLVLALATLAAIIALGHVEQATSFGLSYVLGGLTAIAGGFANWFGQVDKKEGN